MRRRRAGFVLVVSGPWLAAGPPPTATAPTPRVARGWLALLGFSAGLASAGTTATGAFLVQSVVGADLDVGFGGLILAAGDLTAVGLRVSLGWFVDRISAHVWAVVGGVLTLAGAGFAALAFASGHWAIGAGGILATASTSGWQGLFNYAVVPVNPATAAVATGVTQTGVHFGGFVGPVVFGALAAGGGTGPVQQRGPGGGCPRLRRETRARVARTIARLRGRDEDQMSAPQRWPRDPPSSDQQGRLIKVQSQA